jgi:hypothetical protein
VLHGRVLFYVVVVMGVLLVGTEWVNGFCYLPKSAAVHIAHTHCCRSPTSGQHMLHHTFGACLKLHSWQLPVF